MSEINDSGDFVGENVFIQRKDDGWIEGKLYSIEENGIILMMKESYYDGGEKKETTTYFIPHHNISFIKYSPHSYYEDDK